MVKGRQPLAPGILSNYLRVKTKKKVERIIKIPRSYDEIPRHLTSALESISLMFLNPRIKYT